MRKRFLGFFIRTLTLTVFSLASARAAYVYDFPSLLNPYTASQWDTPNGTISASNNMITSSGTGSMIFNPTVPGVSNSYEVRTTLAIPQTGAFYYTFLRASPDAEEGSSPQGTWYYIQINPAYSGSVCSADLNVRKRVAGTVTTMLDETVPCNDGMVVRSVITQSNYILVYLNNVLYALLYDTSIASGQPGVGVRAASGGCGITAVDIGHLDTIAPTPFTSITGDAFRDRVDLQWPAATDDPNGTGIAYYAVFRNGTEVARTSGTSFSDFTATANNTYAYSVEIFDYHGNAATTSTNITTPSTIIDPRETGVRPTGSYWGAAGEQLDMRSGNLNYTIPIVKAMGRGGWGVGFNLSYNSQNWRQDPTGTWQLGIDSGYGYGWRLQAGSLTPLYSSAWVLAGYVFIDATGAEYRLTVNNSGVWSSLESVYVYYDSTVGKLHFTDGSYWTLGSTSAVTEQDAGTMYPTMMEDTNGNEVFITYDNGYGSLSSNTSSRVSTIEDVRGYGAADYNFTYAYLNPTDPFPHLTSISNTIGTSEKYSFTYQENYALNSPFNSSQNFGNVSLLQSSAATSIPLTTYFSYDTTSATTSCSSPGTGTSGPGQLTQVTTPYCGYLRWTYNSHSLLGSLSFYQVQFRYLSKSIGAAETTMQISRANDTSNPLQLSGTLDDLTANARKIWNFDINTADFNLGLVTQYSEKILSSLTTLSQLNYAWSQTPTSLNPYISTTTTHLDPDTANEVKKTTQTLDQYGNLLTMNVYNFGAGTVGPLARTYTNTYLNNSNYTPLYIFNRLSTSTVTDGTNTAALVSNTYDSALSNPNTTPCGQLPGPNQPPQLCEHDANYSTSWFYRGNVATSTTPTTTRTIHYDITGSVTTTVTNGVTSTVTTTNNYAAPGQITTNNSLTSTMNWTNALGLSSATGPNGDTGSINYDVNARPSTVGSPYGAVTTYSYFDTSSPPNKYATTDGHWVQTVMDGFGRTTQTNTGYNTTTLSHVDIQYAPCGCSPLGKLSQQSQPYAPGGTPANTLYTYDASGRTLSVALPDATPPNQQSTTHYVYAGNTVQVTDPANNSKTFTMDAFGNLVTVQEYDPTLASTVTASYTYDVLNHLTGVSMPRGTYGTQTRTFNYNSGTTVTGFLQSATNPENGTVTYTYGNGLLLTKTDAKTQKLLYAHDTYNRLTTVTLSPSTLLRTYYYDTNPLDTTGFSQNPAGRLTAVQYPSQSTVQMNEMYSYSQAGLPLAKRFQVNEPVTYKDQNNQIQHTTMTANLDSDYTYNGEGEMLTMSYPSTMSSLTSSPGASYTYSYDSMYRLSGMTDSNHNTIVSGVTYNAANQMLTGPDTRTYNVLGQLTSISVSSGGNLENLTYNYPSGTNNGKISSMYNAISGETVSYTYDSLNRLLTASGSGWGQQYGFDSFGNLLSKTITAGSGPSLSQAVNPANNQIVGGGYDANGNNGTAVNAGVTYGLSYDPENRMVIATQAGYQAPYVDYYYDSQNRRIWSWAGAVDAYNNTNTYNVNVYSPGGQKLGAYLIAPAFIQNSQTQFQVVPSMQVTLSSSDTYFGSRRLAVMDQLGSVVKSAAPVVSYFPWGETKGASNPQDTWNFATYWQDSTTGLDYANNRYYSNIGGRFMTPDPYQASGGSADPQSWNRYAYAESDPVNRVDPTGLLSEDGGDGGDGGDSPDPQGVRPNQPTQGGGGNGGGGGGYLSAWNKLSADCQNGLRTKFGPKASYASMLAALQRANSNMSTLTSAADDNGIAPALLAAIGIRESGFNNILQTCPAGMTWGDPKCSGAGIFQIDVGRNPDVSKADALDPSFAADWAADLLATNMKTLAAEFPSLTPTQLVQATADSYNFGTKNIYGNPATMDVGTTGNNYGSNVLNLMDCFH